MQDRSFVSHPSDRGFDVHHLLSAKDINRPEIKKDRYQSLLRAIDIGSLNLVVQFLPEPLEFLLIVADAVNLHTAKYHRRYAPANQKSDQQPCEFIHLTSPSLHFHSYLLANGSEYLLARLFPRCQAYYCR